MERQRGKARAKIWPISAMYGSALTAMGCGPSIYKFGAQPNVTCPNTPVTLSWNASAAGKLSSTAATPALGDVANQGSVPVAPAQTTKYRLDVCNLFGSASREVDVDVRNVPTGPKAIGQSVADPSAGCDATNVWVTAVAPPQQWDAHLIVESVGAIDGRTYRLEHGGRAAEVAPSALSSAFKGLPIAGPWKLTTALRPGEVCGTQTAPTNLLVNVYPACTP